MTKKHAVALADTVRHHNMYYENKYTEEQIQGLAHFLLREMPRFDKTRWLRYVRTGKDTKNATQ